MIKYFWIITHYGDYLKAQRLRDPDNGNFDQMRKKWVVFETQEEAEETTFRSNMIKVEFFREQIRHYNRTIDRVLEGIKKDYVRHYRGKREDD